MNTIKDGVNSLSLIAHLNWDRFLYLGLIGGSLFAGAWMMASL